MATLGGRVSIAGRGGVAGRGWRRAAGSPRRGRVRAVVASPVVRRAGVSPRAPGGGGEPRAARTHAGRGLSAARPPPPPGRRARSRPPRARPAPRLRPVFLWTRHHEGTVHHVHCEDYDPRNRIRIARTAAGWRVIPRTLIYDTICVPPLAPTTLPPKAVLSPTAASPPAAALPTSAASPSTATLPCTAASPPRTASPPTAALPPSVVSPSTAVSPPTAASPPAATAPPAPEPAASARPERPRRRPGRPRRARPAAWLAPDLESHIPSHTIAVPRPAPPPPLEPTPLDNLLAVAELEFNQQRGEELELDQLLLPEETVARDVMSYQLGEPKTSDEMFFETSKAHAPERPEDDAFQNVDLGVHKDLFETISEAHYLPELGDPHDEELLESLVEKGCEDNQIIGQAIDKLVHIVHTSSNYHQGQDDLLLSNAPVSDIIDRLESLESPGRSSMTAAQGLLHLHHIGDHLVVPDHQPESYIPSEVCAPNPPEECSLDALSTAPQITQLEVNGHTPDLEYEQDANNKSLVESEASNVIFTDSEQLKSVEDEKSESSIEPENEPLPDQNEVALPNKVATENNEDELGIEPSECETLPKVEPEDDREEDSEFSELINDPQRTEGVELVPVNLSIESIESTFQSVGRVRKDPAQAAQTTNSIDDSEKSEEQPRDLSVSRRLPSPHASPRRIDIPRAPSRESDSMQSPQPSGIPAIPSSPEIFTMPITKSKQALFLETLLSSPSPKMYTSEVTVTKQHSEPTNAGKHRKSASPTVSSCSDEIRKTNKEFGEPQEKKLKLELAKALKDLHGFCEDESGTKEKKAEQSVTKFTEYVSPLNQLLVLKSSSEFNIPDPLVIPRTKVRDILANPAAEIPALLVQRPDLRMPSESAFTQFLQDPEVLVLSLSQLEYLLKKDAEQSESSPKGKETERGKRVRTSSERSEQPSSQQPDQTTPPNPIPSMDALAGDIDVANSAALNQMLWLPYLSQLEAMASCSQNMDFMKALNSAGYTGSNYAEMPQMLNPQAPRFIGPSGFPVMPPMDYENRMQFAMWQEVLNQANASQRPKSNTMETQTKETPSKANDVQNPFVHSTKSHQIKPHTSARTSPIAPSYNSNQRSMMHGQFMQNMYPGMNPNIRPNMPLPGIQIPFFNPNMMSQRSPRMGQQKSPTSTFYQNNNYLQSMKHSEAQAQSRQRSSSVSSQGSPRPRISVKSLHNLLEPAPTSSGMNPGRRSSNQPSTVLGRRREEPEVGSTTPGEPPAHMPPHPHDPASFHLWHPLFGNHNKNQESQWPWTVSATGE